jgi:hypothetical protein
MSRLIHNIEGVPRRLLTRRETRRVTLVTNRLQEIVMDAPITSGAAEKLNEPEMAEEICKSLEQTILKYFPQAGFGSDRPKTSSVPLVPHRQEQA